jgi:tetratricopeptide (TPR) repeat protein
MAQHFEETLAMATQKPAANAIEIDRLATQLAKDPQSKAFLPLAEEYCKVGMWEEAVGVLEDGLKYYPGFITAMVVLGRAYDQLNQPTKARAVLEGAIKLSPENLRAHRILIKIYTAQGLKEEALRSCGVILVANPKDEEARSIQASLGVSDSAPAKSNISYQPASELLPPAPPRDGQADKFSALASSVDTSTGTARHLEDQEDWAPRSEATTVQPQPLMGAAPHAGTITHLESWLRSLHRRRRDRPSPDVTESDP